MVNEAPLLAFFGHHRGATTWINDILIQVCHEMGLKLVIVHNPEMFNYDLEGFVRKEKPAFLSYTNADYEYVKHLSNFRGFHVVRDPRDIVVSSYFSDLYSHPTSNSPGFATRREELRNLSRDQGLMAEMEYRRGQFKRMYEWPYSLPNVIEVRMEDIIENPYQRFLEISRFLGILDEAHFGTKKRLKHLFLAFARRIQHFSRGHPVIPISLNKIPAERLLGIIFENDFTRKSGGRKPGEEDVKSHYRKGVAGDWRNYFKEEHIAFFKSNYHDVLVKLGYEQNRDW